jgi:chromosome segregation ATPase
MSQLLRIILIHTHLPSVVEIQMDEHTNICGTNASGKTTLQRLVPVFYGELPNRVVPKTRKKFDEFYLPYSNSYIVYEYCRDKGDICQAVLTKKSDGGLEYRFVGIPYDSAHYLQEDDNGGVKAYSYGDWSSIMRHQAAGQFSAKIGATSEYRSIIQNDAAALRGNNAESIKLRRLAATFSLVSGHHKLRHIEKLVSAVHAKEGKMDTLKAMLAAIFEEDGVTLPTTKVKNTKARDWILQMRQSMKLGQLQQDFDHLKQTAQQLEGAESQLVALQPLLQNDEQAQKQSRAESEETLHALRGELQKLKDHFDDQQSDLNSSLSKTEYDLKEATDRLDQMQNRYDSYEARDMAKLQRDSDALPLSRENLQELQEQYQLMAEQHGDLERQLDLRKIKLSESLERLSQQHSAKVKQLQLQKDQIREAQDNTLSALDQRFQGQFQAQQQGFSEQDAEYRSAIAVLESELTHSPLTDAEHHELRTAEARLEQAQAQAQQHSRQLPRVQQELQQARERRDQADKNLEQQRKQANQAEQARLQLQRQLTPEHGSLRHFLRQNYQGWEQSLGKVLDEALLERQDLQPHFSVLTDTLYGLKLELHNVDVPDYAQDEEAIQHRIQQAEQQFEEANRQRAHGEKVLKEQHEQTELIRAQLEQVQWQSTEHESNIEYARDARDRLKAQQQELTLQRQAKTRSELAERKQQLEALKSQQ